MLLNNRVLSFSLTRSHISLMVGMLQDTTATNGQKFCLLIVMRVLKEKMNGKNQFWEIYLKKKYYLKEVLERQSLPSEHLWEENQNRMQC